ncbi:MAG TPA: helix-turn-helix domain-containing protein, partial [Caulobacteraceae bacterium]
VARLRDAVVASTGLRSMLASYMELTAAEAQQTAGCNALHHLPARLAKWLLRCHDRAETDVLNLTQEFLSEMLGAHRTTVTQVAQGLQDAGLIRYQRGRILVLDRAGLEAAACECYAVITSRWAELDPVLGGGQAGRGPSA